MTDLRTVDAGLPIRLGTLGQITITPDAPLETADRGLLGSVLTCEACGDQLGPVRSYAEADGAILRHLRRSHPGLDERPSVFCSIEDCWRTAYAHELCAAHLRQHWNAHAPRCSVANCDRPARSGRSSICEGHAIRLRKHGDLRADIPLGAKPPKTPKPPKPSKPQHCAVAGCDRPRRTLDYCSGHYKRLRTTGDIRADIPLAERTRARQCSVPGCERRHEARGYCSSHYERLRTTGDVRAEIPLGGSK